MSHFLFLDVDIFQLVDQGTRLRLKTETPDRSGGSGLMGTRNPAGYDGRNLGTTVGEEADDSLGEADDHQDTAHSPKELAKKRKAKRP